jgi:hypothetical protein
MAPILLIGNGPSYFSGQYGWQDVVRFAARRVRMANEVESLISEPLPLVYEAIASRHPSEDRRIRVDIAAKMRAMRYNPVHEQLMALKLPTVLTTNYDRCLESASGERFAAKNLESGTTYSLFRRQQSNNLSVWHIHGDMDGPRTMMLGLHHYAGYLQKLRRYLTTRAGGSTFVFGDRSWKPEDGPHSWADLFLRGDVHIVGLGLHYSETVLWWLLSYKQRLRSAKRLPIGSTTYYQIGNAPTSDKRLKTMMAVGVTIKPIQSATKYPSKADWDRLIEMLEGIARP